MICRFGIDPVTGKKGLKFLSWQGQHEFWLTLLTENFFIPVVKTLTMVFVCEWEGRVRLSHRASFCSPA